MTPNAHRLRRGALALALTLASWAAPARASFHLIDVNEVFTNADGTVQYVELIARANSQTNLAPTRLNGLNASGSTTTLLYDWTAAYPALGAGETVLIATPGFEAVVGFAPDFVMVANSLVSAPDGRVTFAQDTGSIVDAVAYGAFTGSNTGYGTPAAALPTDGCTSLTRTQAGVSNSADFGSALGTPTRNDGTTTTLSCPPPPVPSAGLAAQAALVGSLLGASGWTLARLRRRVGRSDPSPGA